MGMGSPQRTAVDVVVGGPNSALRNVPRQFWSPQTIGAASRWAGRPGVGPGKHVIFAWCGARHRGEVKKFILDSLFSRGAAAPPVRK